MDDPPHSQSEPPWPKLQPYVDSLRATGYVADSQDLLDRRPDLLATVFHDWAGTDEIACEFAMHLSAHREQAGWLEVVLPTSPNMAWWAAPSLRASAHDDTEAALLVLPDCKSPTDLAAITALLCRHEDWWWEEVDAEADRDQGHFLVGLRWQPPGLTAPSWVLAFGDFQGFPRTRRAPVPALTLRTRGPPNRKTGALDLARMDSLMSSEDGGEAQRRTRENKEALVESGLQHAAKAKVSFRLREDARRILEDTG